MTGNFWRYAAAILALAVPIAEAGPIQFNAITLATNGSDSNLVNAWGIAASATSPLWLADNGTGTSVVYTGAGSKVALTVGMPNAAPISGIVFNGSSGFNADSFLFDGEDGGLYGWRGALGTTAETLMTPSSTSEYKGLAIASVGGFDYAYLANFKTGNVDVVKGEAAAPNLTGVFADPNLPAGYAPFNVQVLNGVLYIAYAEVNTTTFDEVDGPGLGLVDTFDLNGNLLGRLTTAGVLDAPWGLAIAPSSFGGLGGDLLVGNFGNGQINAFDPTTGNFLETLSSGGAPLMIDGLWGLRFGSGSANGGPAGTLYFTAGPADESEGRFGEILPTPEPAAWTFGAAAILFAALRVSRGRRLPGRR